MFFFLGAGLRGHADEHGHRAQRIDDDKQRQKKLRVLGPVKHLHAAPAAPRGLRESYLFKRQSLPYRRVAFSRSPMSGNDRVNYKMPIARDARSAMISSDIVAWTIVSALAHRDSTGVSEGENAVLVLNATNR